MHTFASFSGQAAINMNLLDTFYRGTTGDTRNTIYFQVHRTCALIETLILEWKFTTESTCDEAMVYLNRLINPI